MKDSDRENGLCPGVTGVILAGGESSRMGRDKATLRVDGERMFDRNLQVLKRFFPRILIAGKRPDLGGTRLPWFADIYPGSALGGIYTGLFHAETPHIFVTACDLPFPSGELIRPLLEHRREKDVVVYRTRDGLEPLFALYGKACLDPVNRMLEEGRFRVYDFYPQVRTCYLDPDDFVKREVWRRSLRNINTPEDYRALQE